jgi:predicted PurR-regulated permease PerM
VALSLAILAPFVMLVLWAGVIAVAVYPLYQRLERGLGGRAKLALTLFTLLTLAVLIVPSVMLGDSMFKSIHTISTQLDAGTLQVPPPSQSVAEWPLVGPKLHEVWSGASRNLSGTLNAYSEDVKKVASWLLGTAASAGAALLQFIIAVLIAAAFMANAKPIGSFLQRLAVRLAGERGQGVGALAGSTVRSVAQGVLGVAVIQALLSGIGMLLAGVPGAGLWAVLVLVLAVIQLPPILVLGPVAAYVFSEASTLTASLFLVWALFVSTSDAFLKPMLLGRGLDIPMLVILLGAIGGMLFAGIIGLFVGSVVLALTYRLFVAWLDEGFDQDEPSDDSHESAKAN